LRRCEQTYLPFVYFIPPKVLGQRNVWHPPIGQVWAAGRVIRSHVVILPRLQTLLTLLQDLCSEIRWGLCENVCDLKTGDGFLASVYLLLALDC